MCCIISTNSVRVCTCLKYNSTIILCHYTFSLMSREVIRAWLFSKTFFKLYHIIYNLYSLNTYKHFQHLKILSYVLFYRNTDGNYLICIQIHSCSAYLVRN